MPFEPILILDEEKLKKLREKDLDLTESPLGWTHFPALKALVDVLVDPAKKYVVGFPHACALMQAIIRFQETEFKILKGKTDKKLLDHLTEQGISRSDLSTSEWSAKKKAAILEAASAYNSQLKKSSDPGYYHWLMNLVEALLQNFTPQTIQEHIHTLNDYVEKQFLFDSSRSPFVIFDAAHPQGQHIIFRDQGQNKNHQFLFNYFKKNYQLSDEQCYAIAYSIPQGTFKTIATRIDQFFVAPGQYQKGPNVPVYHVKHSLYTLPIQIFFGKDNKLQSIVYGAVHRYRILSTDEPEYIPYAYSYTVVKPSKQFSYNPQNPVGTIPLIVTAFGIYGTPDAKQLLEPWLNDIDRVFRIPFWRKPFFIVSMSALSTSVLVTGIVVGLLFALPLLGVTLPVIVPTLVNVAIIVAAAIAIVLLAAGLGGGISYCLYRWKTAKKIHPNLESDAESAVSPTISDGQQPVDNNFDARDNAQKKNEHSGDNPIVDKSQPRVAKEPNYFEHCVHVYENHPKTNFQIVFKGGILGEPGRQEPPDELAATAESDDESGDQTRASQHVPAPAFVNPGEALASVFSTTVPMRESEKVDETTAQTRISDSPDDTHLTIPATGVPHLHP